MSRTGEEYVRDSHRFWRGIDQEKMIHVVIDGWANSNPGAAGWGSLFRQSRHFTMQWKHFDHATNNTMELRAAAEALKYLPVDMNVWITRGS
jgi:ribonuclease HI